MAVLANPVTYEVADTGSVLLYARWQGHVRLGFWLAPAPSRLQDTMHRLLQSCGSLGPSHRAAACCVAA